MYQLKFTTTKTLGETQVSLIFTVLSSPPSLPSPNLLSLKTLFLSQFSVQIIIKKKPRVWFWERDGVSIGESVGFAGLRLGRNSDYDEEAEEGYKRRLRCVYREVSVASSSSAASSQSSSSSHRPHFRRFRRVSPRPQFLSLKFCLFPEKCSV